MRMLSVKLTQTELKEYPSQPYKSTYGSIDNKFKHMIDEIYGEATEIEAR